MAHGVQSFIADGFADDCDELIHRCLKDAPVTFKVFSKHFRAMQMSSLFHDRQSGAEIAELSEEVINIAKHYMVANTGCFEETVVGVFLVYALVNLQPFQEFAYLRIVEDDVPYVERIEQVARRDKRVDVLYVLGRLLTENTRYYAAVRERGMEPSYRKYLEGCTAVDSLGLRPKGVFLRQNEELDIIKELTELQIRYDETKKAAKVDDLNYTDAKFPTELGASLNNIIAGMIHEDKGVENEQEQDTVRSIKDRAMKNKVNPMKHLIGIEDRTPSKPSTPHRSDIKTAPGKVKTGSPTKKITTNRTKVKITAQRKRKRESTDSDETAEDSDLPKLSDHESDEADINLDDFSKATPSTVVAKANNTDAKTNEVTVDSRNIRMGALPCVITSEDNGKTYQIEIIDKFKRPIKSTPQETSRREFTKSSADEEISKGPKDKRDLKKTILKSRFKRMGIEPIANFKAT